MMRSTSARRLLLLPMLAISAAAPALQAQAPVIVDPALAPIDSMLAELYPAGQPGAAVLVARDGQVLMRKAYGAASVELGVPLRPEHVFRIGSITKQFTAVAALLLVDEGRISLDDEITRFFPDYPTHGRRITVEHLLTHSSGIQSYTGIPSYRASMRRDVPVDSLIAVFRDQPMNFAPGEDFRYNNSGYALLGAIIEKVSGMPYAEFLRTRLFEPLGMRNTHYEKPDAVIPGRVPGYDRDGDRLLPAQFVSMTQPYAAGAIVSSVDDLLLWQRAVAEGRLLKPETWRRAFAPYRLADGRSAGYGYGWFLGETAGRQSIEHGGDINGFSSDGVWIPSERLHVIVLANHEREERRNPGDITQRIAARLLNAPEVPAAVAVAPATLQEYVGVYRIGEHERRVITLEDGKLYSTRGRNPRFEIIPTGRDSFAYATGTRARFVRGADGRITGMVNRGRIGPEERVSPRTDESPEAVLAAMTATVAVPVEVLERYVGEYEFGPGMVLTIRRDANRLMARPGSQPELPLVAESQTRFTVVEEGAVLVFQVDASGTVTGLVMNQGGRERPARKIR